MRKLLGLMSLATMLTMSASAAASVPSPDAEPVAQAKPPADPHAFSNGIKSSVNDLFTIADLTLMFRPSLSGITLRISGRF